jgi:hypothetical protein
MSRAAKKRTTRTTGGSCSINNLSAESGLLPPISVLLGAASRADMDALPALTAVETVPALPAADFEIAKDFARAENAPATRRAYRSDFELFSAWCAPRRVAAIPASPETVAAFLAAEAARGIKPSSIGRRIAAIRYAHKLAGHDNPPTNSEIVKATARGIRRSIGACAKPRSSPKPHGRWRMSRPIH